MTRRFAIIGAILGFLAVALGAFAAHSLKGRVTARGLEVFHLGARYQLAHALALFAVAWATSRWSHRALPWAGWAFVTGVVLFSGSLYLYATTGQRAFAMITPVGGLSFLAGWSLLAWGAARGRRDR